MNNVNGVIENDAMGGQMSATRFWSWLMVLGLTIVAGVFLVAPLVKIAPKPPGLETRHLDDVLLWLLLAGGGIPLLCAFNVGLFAWYRYLVIQARSRELLVSVATDAALSVLRKGMYWQVLLFLLMALSCHFDSYFGYASWFMTFGDTLMLGAGGVRLGTVFLAMRHACNGSSLAGVLAAVSCLDVWWVFAVIYNYRFA